MREAVVFVHGIWMKGWEMSVLRRRMAALGYDCYQFSYSSIFARSADNAARLNAFIKEKVEADVVHVVAHSLGGIVVSHLLDAFPLQKPGRIVFIGSPLKGSVVARRLSSHVLTRGFLGLSGVRGLLGNVPRLKSQREVGMIAGTRGIGVGSFVMLGQLAKPSDGTVVVTETDVTALRAHLQVPFSHFGMLFAKPVAQAVGSFLRQGRFDGLA